MITWVPFVLCVFVSTLLVAGGCLLERKAALGKPETVTPEVAPERTEPRYVEIP